MRKVYRIQNKAGGGPYTSYGSRSDRVVSALRGHSYTMRTPGPYLDGIRFEDRESFNFDERYGFVSLKALNNWFRPNVRRILREDGFQLATFAVPEDSLVIGARSGQAIFDVQASELLSIQTIF